LCRYASDQDDFGMEDDLMALCFLETGATWRPAKPWDKYWGGERGGGRGAAREAGDVCEEDLRVERVEALPEGARAALDQMLKMDEKEDDDDEAGKIFHGNGDVSWED
jgi:hypothetical protein